MPRARGGDQPIENFQVDLALPAGFFDRSPERLRVFHEAIDFLEHQLPRNQNHWPALALAIVAQAEELLEALNLRQVDDVFSTVEVETSAAGGGARNTLNFVRPDGEMAKLRPFYMRAVAVIRYELRRFAHPHGPGHATQSWPQYRPFISSVFRASPGERAEIARWVWQRGVLSIAETLPGEVGAVRRERPFAYVLEHMPTASRTGGAIFQAEAYAYLRADAPNVILESHAVNVGSRRAGLVGDVDGFRGDAVELAAEVKDLLIDGNNLDEQLGDFLLAVAEIPNATAIVFALGFTDVARDVLAEQNVVPIDRPQMAATASVWDLSKQAEAMRALVYFLGRIQNSPALVELVREFCAEHGLDSP